MKGNEFERDLSNSFVLRRIGGTTYSSGSFPQKQDYFRWMIGYLLCQVVEFAALSGIQEDECR
jgi:hypothetical protein